MKGRYFAENILKLTNIIDYCDKNKKPALLVSFDLIMLVASHFVCRLMCLSTPPDYIFVRFRRMVAEFIWDSKYSKIRYGKIIQYPDRGGLNKGHGTENFVGYKSSAKRPITYVLWATY